MLQPERFDVLVLGSGTGGKLIVWHMARSGQRTALWSGGGSACRTGRLNMSRRKQQCRSCFP
jgi:pyruvate/2-oxoglutarate dehydrogenase complex dihydrolipoamide dehydrogenase (E3) component